MEWQLHMHTDDKWDFAPSYSNGYYKWRLNVIVLSFVSDTLIPPVKILF